MKRLTIGALAMALSLAGCDGSPLQAFMQETFGSGQHLQTNAFVQEIAPGLPYPPPILAVSPDGRRYAYNHGREDGRLYLGESGHAARPLDAYSHRSPFWSPDGKRLAYAQPLPGDDQRPRWALRVHDLEAQSSTMLTDDFYGHSPWVAWSPDGSALLYSSDVDGDANAETLYHVSLSASEPQRIAELAPYGMDSAPALWSPDGKQIAYLAKIHGYLDAFNLTIHSLTDESRKVLRRVPGRKTYVWSTNGEAIGYLSAGSQSGDFSFHRIRLSDGAEEVTPFALGTPTATTTSSGMQGWVGFHVSDLSPDHRWAIITHGDDPLFARELATGKHIALTDTRAWVRGWTADSKAIIASTSKGSVDRYYRIQVER